MDDSTLGRISALESKVENLRVDLDKLITSHLARNKLHGEVCRIVTDLARAQCHLGEKLDDTFFKAFPEHGRYLDAIDDALARASKLPKD